MLVRFGPWLRFEQAYQRRPERPRSGMFEPRTRALTEPAAGIYLIADDRLGDLREPACVIYLGCTVGTTKPSSFHERLWKHCCKAAGESGGGHEPRKTRRWEAYRLRHGGADWFAHWHFSLATVTLADLRSGRSLVESLECTALREYERLNGNPPPCNGQQSKRPPGSFEIVFPWGGR